jgi:hypothetical protein
MTDLTLVNRGAAPDDASADPLYVAFGKVNDALSALNGGKMESGGLATVATSGAYADLSGRPTLGTAAAAATTDFAAAVHTHTAANVSDFSEAVDDRVASLLTAGANVTLTYNDAANTLTIAATGGGGGSGVAVQDEGGAVATATTLNFVGEGVTAADAGSGVVTVTLAAATTGAAGAVQLSTATNSTSDALAATPSAVKSAYDLANAALPKSGGTMTGAINLGGQSLTNGIGHKVTGTHQAIGAVGTNQSLDAGAYASFSLEPTANITISTTGWGTGLHAIQLELTGGGDHTLPWTGVTWDGGAAPTLKTTTGVDVIILYTRDSGTTIRAKKAWNS